MPHAEILFEQTKSQNVKYKSVMFHLHLVSFWLIFRVRVVLSRAAVVKSDWCFDNWSTSHHDDFRWKTEGCWDVNYCYRQQHYNGLLSSRRSNYSVKCYSKLLNFSFSFRSARLDPAGVSNLITRYCENVGCNLDNSVVYKGTRSRCNLFWGKILNTHD